MQKMTNCKKKKIKGCEHASILQWLSQSKDFRDPLTNMRYEEFLILSGQTVFQ